MRIGVGVANFMKFFRRRQAATPLPVAAVAATGPDTVPAQAPARPAPVSARPAPVPKPAPQLLVEDDFEATRQHEPGPDYDPYAPTTPMPLHGGRGEPTT